MANQAIAPAPAAQSKPVTSVPAPVKLPEAFQDKPEPSTPAPSLDAFEELEQIDAGNPAPDSRPPKKQASAEKPAEKTDPAKAKPETAEKPSETLKKPGQDKPKEDGASKEPEEGEKKAKEPTDPLAPDDPTKKFQLASDLRRDYRRLHAENERLASEVKQLRNGKPESTEERKVIESKLANLEKRNKELEEEISYRDYTKSSEFQEKFKKPFETKLARVYSQIEDLYVRDAEGNERPATRNDFDRVLESPNSDARRIAKEIFGEEDFREVLQYRRELNELQQNADAEMKSWREKAQERETNTKLEQRKQREQAEEAFKKSIDTYTEKYPEWFGEIEGDDELNKALHQGFASVDRPHADPNIPIDQKIDLLAATRLKAASFPRLVIQNRRMAKKIAELEQALKDYQKSEPGEGQGQRTVASGTDDGFKDAADEIDEIERRNPVTR